MLQLGVGSIAAVASWQTGKLAWLSNVGTMANNLQNATLQKFICKRK